MSLALSSQELGAHCRSKSLCLVLAGKGAPTLLIFQVVRSFDSSPCGRFLIWKTAWMFNQAGMRASKTAATHCTRKQLEAIHDPEDLQAVIDKARKEGRELQDINTDGGP